MNGKDLFNLFIPVIGDKSFNRKLSQLSLFAPNTIGYYLCDKRKIIPAHEKYFHMLARELENGKSGA